MTPLHPAAGRHRRCWRSGSPLAGILAYAWLPVAPAAARRDSRPSRSAAGLPGADPETIAASVVAPLERRLGAIAGLAEMTSSTPLGAFLPSSCNSILSRASTARRATCRRRLNAAGDRPAAGLPQTRPS